MTRVAIVHDFLFQNGGAEKVVDSLLEIYPNADVYTSFSTPEKFQSAINIKKAFDEKRVFNTIIQTLYNLKFKNQRVLAKFQKHLFWLYPVLMRLTTIKNYDLVIISSTDCAKQVRFHNCPKIIHYCHSPTRYLNGLVTEADHKSLPYLYRILIPIFKFFLKPLDQKAVRYLNSVGCIWVANSIFIQQTIKQIYNTDSVVIYPPIELEKFLPLIRKISITEPFFLCHGRISFHKRLDLAIGACLELGIKLKISGVSGMIEQMNDLKNQVDDYVSKNPEKAGLIEFLGRTSEKQYFNLLETCSAFLFPGKEDFGITPIEVLASGVTVIAFGEGGALEYIKNGENGVLFKEQTINSLKNAILKFQELDKTNNWKIDQIKNSSKDFSTEKFQLDIQRL